MSDQRNAIKSKAKQLKNLLKEKGIDLKHTQSLEVMSKVLYNKPWHSFKKEESQVLNDLLLKEDLFEKRDLISLPENYFDYLNNDLFKDRIVMGLDEKTNKLFLSDQIVNPNLLICGTLGSGKSNSLKFTLLSHIANNSEDTVYFLVDTISGMLDFHSIYKNKKYSRNIISCINDYDYESFDKVQKMIDFLTMELSHRKKEFYKIGAKDYSDYKKKTNKKLTKFMIAFENFYSIPNHPKIKYHMNLDKDESNAKKLKELFRLGRRYGIFFILSTQRATAEDVPSGFKSSISNLLLFRVSNPGEASAMNLAHGQEIKGNEVGRCAYENGFLNIPYISEDIEKNVLEKYYKPLKSESFVNINNYFNKK